ncbi:hypothetical protein [Solemya velum gill symbiont]|uniref:Uncharacterized protein n=1 Tax=Solemya velum gill symbiont TaxID=2340 RepID=A0A0B0HBH0_SOVGS|nr:hypothetical protein [Solemya velum gill symbiont]KHF25229.1 hypothetical protein JV46_05940 [Solemya velum gill symbiont]OOY34175.1 hypothetical protein BOV88_11300 [Solemya velum gill symbiont]OOY36873.1 hypothetical protein BOV89_10215 [Solemya velum gill symbiont]OOY40035.1 hypothetical protein BOV90_06085 [Solemya velum gill symbiont]OOY43145.1 hypothetical protein BOV91_04805 [Solemya velum gill symbiont]
MHRAGTVATVIGILLIAIGLVAGFTLLLLDQDDEAITLLSIIPVGFVLTLGGLTATQLSRPDN